ncbi:DUF1275 domain-containing protein [Lactococcus taiwanensis]|uniref:DUF1275 domain-containing protein n=1 Tax=Lactococcus taiwanensis TaxID=1151742 RepID=A0AA45KFA4_9LACT|nr:YoaK family protein [Lactococcus taiwanensis]QSE76295.1 DUF1275 domain-containing protein [Lactococcus taiwanensis]
MNKRAKEKLVVPFLLALNAGFIDGFSFFHFDYRFIGMQSGNVIQAGISIAKGSIINFWDFAIPIILFILGVITRGFYSYYLTQKGRFEFSSLILLQLSGITILTTIFALGVDLSATLYVGLFSYFMAIQFDAFSKIRELGYSNIIMSGNIKSLASNLTQYILTKKITYLQATRIYMGLIISFFAGIIISVTIGTHFGKWTLLGSSLVLCLVFIITRSEEKMSL